MTTASKKVMDVGIAYAHSDNYCLCLIHVHVRVLYSTPMVCVTLSKLPYLCAYNLCFVQCVYTSIHTSYYYHGVLFTVWQGVHTLYTVLDTVDHCFGCQMGLGVYAKDAPLSGIATPSVYESL